MRIQPKVTACLITWKRQENMGFIVPWLLQQPFIDEIIIQDNAKSPKRNLINYARYVSAAKASNRIIYTQDDDCFVHNIAELYEVFIKDPERIAAGGPREDFESDRHIFGERQMTLMGWGAFFSSDWIGVLNKYTAKYGQDYCYFRETDRIFSILLNRHHNVIRADIDHLPGYDNEDALSSQSEHMKYKELAIKRALCVLDQ